MPPHQLFDIGARGDSCSRDNTPSSIGDYDLEDDFIDDDPIQDGSSNPRHSPVGSVPPRSPGLFCTPGPEVRQSIESHSDQRQPSASARLFGRSLRSPGGVLPSLHLRDDRRSLSPLRDGTVGPVSVPIALPSRQRRGGRRTLLPARQLRLPSLPEHDGGDVRRSASAHSDPDPVRQPGRVRKRQREYPSEDDRSPSIASDHGRSRSRSNSDEPLLRKLARSHLRSASVASRDSDIQSLQRGFDGSRHSSVQSDRRSYPFSVTSDAESVSSVSRSGSVASSRGSQPDQAPVDATDDPFTIPSHLRVEECQGIGVPGTRLATGKPRWVCRHFLFTFSQSGPNWPSDDFIALIGLLGGKLVVGRERHLDGGYHFHCIVDFERKFEFENPHRFCVGERGDRPPTPAEIASGVLCPGQTHGNILPISRTPFHTWDYVKKYGDIIFENLERPVVRGPNTTRDDNFKGSMALTTKVQFLEDVKGHSPRDFILFGGAIRASADVLYGVDRQPPERQDNAELGIRVFWERYPTAREWFRDYFADPIPVIQATSGDGTYSEDLRTTDQAALALRGNVKKRPHSIIVFGGSRLGKTDWARSLGAHCYFRGTFNLKTLIAIGSENIEYMIWDDVSWKDSALKDENYKNWMGGQDKFTVTDKYRGKVDIVWGKPAIFLSNHDPLIGLREDDQCWLKSNCTIVDLGPEPDVRANAICEGTVYN